MGRLKLNRCKHPISLHISHPICIKTNIIINICHRINISCNTSIISIPHSNHTLREGVVETSEAEEEEDLAEEEVRLHAITVNNRVTMLEIARSL